MLTVRRKLLSWHQYFRLSISCRPSHHYQYQADKTTLNKLDSGGKSQRKMQQKSYWMYVVQLHLGINIRTLQYLSFHMKIGPFYFNTTWLHSMQQKNFLEWVPVKSSDEKVLNMKLTGSNGLKWLDPPDVVKAKHIQYTIVSGYQYEEGRIADCPKLPQGCIYYQIV